MVSATIPRLCIAPRIMLGAKLLRAALLRINPWPEGVWREEVVMELWIREGAFLGADENDRMPRRAPAGANLAEANIL